MEKAGYWDLMETSVIIFVAYSLFSVVVPLNNLLGTVVSSIISVAVTVFAFGLIGYKISKDKKTNIKSGKVGAWTGVVVGLVYALIAILTFYLFPEKIAEAISAAAKQGLTTNVTKAMIEIGLYINLIILPLIYAALGAFISWISFLIFKKK